MATRYGKHESVTMLLEAKVDVNAKDKVGFSPLAHAAFEGDRDKVAVLLKFGADVNAKTMKG